MQVNTLATVPCISTGRMAACSPCHPNSLWRARPGQNQHPITCESVAVHDAESIQASGHSSSPARLRRLPRSYSATAPQLLSALCSAAVGAASRGNLPILHALVSLNMDWNVPDANGAPPLYHCCMHGMQGHRSFAQVHAAAILLLQHRAHCREPPPQHSHLLHRYLQMPWTPNADLVHLLVQSGAPVRGFFEGKTVLWYAVQYGSGPLLLQLADLGMGPREARPLLTAECIRQHLRPGAIAALLQLGASPNQHDSCGRTPLLAVLNSDFAAGSHLSNGKVTGKAQHSMQTAHLSA